MLVLCIGGLWKAVGWVVESELYHSSSPSESVHVGLDPMQTNNFTSQQYQFNMYTGGGAMGEWNRTI